MNADNAPREPYGRLEVLREGPFAGWSTWSADRFETLLGPFCFKQEDGRARCAFAPRAEHLNGSGAIHGGALMSFADFTLFAIAHNELAAGAKAVTLHFNADFIAAGDLSGWVEGQGEVLHAARSIIFMRGLVTQHSRPLLAFSGALKKITG